MTPLYVREDFEAALASLRQPGHGRSAKITMKSVLENLLRTPEPWASEAFMELLRGDQGAELRVDAVAAVCYGFDVTCDHYRSLVSACIVYNKLELLAAVAALGLPNVVAPSAAGASHATTPTGAWLDLLCSTQAESADQEGRHTLPARIDGLAVKHSKAANVLVDLLIEHDPNHKNIEFIGHGTEAHSIYVKAVLRRQLSRMTTENFGDGPAKLTGRGAL